MYMPTVCSVLEMLLMYNTIQSQNNELASELEHILFRDSNDSIP